MLTFHQAARELFGLHREGRNTEMLSLARDVCAAFPERRTSAGYWLACAEALCGNHTRAITILSELLDSGHWWHPRQLSEEMDFVAIKESVGFRDVLKRNGLAYEAVRIGSRSRLLLMYPDHAVARIIFVLHGQHGDATETEACWRDGLPSDCLLATTQSAIPTAPGKFGWEDEATAAAQVRGQTDMLMSHFPNAQLSLAGFSGGARLALLWALERRILCQRVLAVAPTLTELDLERMSKFDLTTRRPPPIYLWWGETDRFAQTIRRGAELLKSGGVSVTGNESPGVGHTYPASPSWLDSAF